MATPFQTDIQDPQPGSHGTFIQAGVVVYNMASGTYTLTIPAGTLVLRGGTLITEAFDGTSPTIKNGDGFDDDGYQDSTDIAPATALTDTTPAVKLFANSSNPYANGKYYPTADTFDCVFAQASASPTTGKAIVWYEGMRVSKLGIPAGLVNGAAL